MELEEDHMLEWQWQEWQPADDLESQPPPPPWRPRGSCPRSPHCVRLSRHRVLLTPAQHTTVDPSKSVS